MKCPVCPTVDLLMAERQGVEIDYCPQCRGVWLDRGELDKIIEKTAQPAGTDKDRHDGKYHREEKGVRYKKKSSLFKELFDF